MTAALGTAAAPAFAALIADTKVRLWTAGVLNCGKELLKALVARREAILENVERVGNCLWYCFRGGKSGLGETQQKLWRFFPSFGEL